MRKNFSKGFLLALAICVLVMMAPASAFAASVLSDPATYNGTVTGTITSNDETGAVSGTLSGDYNLTIAGTVTSYTNNVATFAGTVSGDINGTISATINDNGIDTLAGEITGTSATSPVRIIGVFPLTGTKGDFQGQIITGSTPTNLMTAMTINSANDATTLEAGQTLQLSVDTTPDNASQKVYWSVWCDNRDCASVDENGLLTGISKGSAVVIAKAADGSQVTATKTITITDTTAPKVTSVAVKFADGTTQTGTDMLFCCQNQVVSSIKVTMSEPVTVTTVADSNVVTMKGTEGDCETKIPVSVTYGTIALDPTDSTNKTLIITPNGSNGTAGYLGEVTFTVGDDVVYDAAENGNDDAAFELNVGLGFTDVNHNSWYFPAITYVTARGIAVGIGNHLFAPEDQITRAEFLVMLMNTFELEPAATWTDNFSDAGSKEYYSGYLAAAKKLGLASGVGDNKFAPNQGITREDMFTLLYRVLDQKEAFKGLDKLNDLSGFKDVNGISSYALTAIKTLVTVGIVHGDNHSMLTPQDPATRAQAAQIFYSLLSQIKPQ